MLGRGQRTLTQGETLGLCHARGAWPFGTRRLLLFTNLGERGLVLVLFAEVDERGRGRRRLAECAARGGREERGRCVV